MLRSPLKHSNSESDVSDAVLGEPTNITFRRRGQDEEFKRLLDRHAESMTRTINAWKTDLEGSIGKISDKLDTVLRSDLSQLNVSAKEMRQEIALVRLEYQQIKQSIQTLGNDQTQMKEKIQDLEKSAEFLGAECNDVKQLMDKFSLDHKQMSAIEQEIANVKRQNESLQMDINLRDQRDRLQNLEIVGIPEDPNEDLHQNVITIGKALNVDICADDIEHANRVAPKVKIQGRPRVIVVKFKSRLHKDNILAGIRKCPITTKVLGAAGDAKSIFINEHLTSFNKILLKKSKELAKLKEYLYVWVKNGRILVRKSDTSPYFQIAQESDLRKIF